MTVYARIYLYAAIGVLFLLAGFQTIWVLGGTSTGIMNQAGLQRARVQSIAKNVLVLAYRPADDHPQAISELQNVLPLWEKTQEGLRKGDLSLQLPLYVPDEIEQLMTAAQPDYISIDMAAHAVLSHANGAIDPAQVTIVQHHERAYTQAMMQVVNAWQKRIDNGFLHLFWIKITLSSITVLLICYVLFYRPRKTANLVQSTSQLEKGSK